MQFLVVLLSLAPRDPLFSVELQAYVGIKELARQKMDFVDQTNFGPEQLAQPPPPSGAANVTFDY